jgi:hypothetical protein
MIGVGIGALFHSRAGAPVIDRLSFLPWAGKSGF